LNFPSKILSSFSIKLTGICIRKMVGKVRLLENIFWCVV
jgi:hypothetical protein